MAKNYLPQPLAAFNTWTTNFAALITDSPATYGLVAGDAATVQAVVDAFGSAYANSTAPGTRTPVTVQATVDARNAAVQVIRSYARIILANAGVADADKTALGLNLRDPVNTPVPAPSTAPVINVIGATPGVLTCTSRDSMAGPKVKAKPFGATQLQVYAQFGTVAPVSPAAAPFRGVFTKTPFALDVSSATPGQTAYIYGRWVNQKGQVGPWSPLASSIIV